MRIEVGDYVLVRANRKMRIAPQHFVGCVVEKRIIRDPKYSTAIYLTVKSKKGIFEFYGDLLTVGFWREYRITSVRRPKNANTIPVVKCILDDWGSSTSTHPSFLQETLHDTSEP